jgi:hypothetical protein
MKIRWDFVTNSSSSSYICEVCSEEVISSEGLYDTGMVQCENGHTFCEDHAVSSINFKVAALNIIKKQLENSYNYSWYTDKDRKNLQDIIDKADEMDEDELVDEASNYDNCNENVPKECCPICQLKSISKNMAIRYLFKKNNMTMDSLTKEIQTRFTNYDEYCDFIRGEENED